MEDPIPHNPFPFAGLDDAAVRAARKAHGTNALEAREHSGLVKAVLATVSEPMFVLLIAASTVYFLLGEHNEGFFLLPMRPTSVRTPTAVTITTARPLTACVPRQARPLRPSPIPLSTLKASPVRIPFTSQLRAVGRTDHIAR